MRFWRVNFLRRHGSGLSLQAWAHDIFINSLNAVIHFLPFLFVHFWALNCIPVFVPVIFKWSCILSYRTQWKIMFDSLSVCSGQWSEGRQWCCFRHLDQKMDISKSSSPGKVIQCLFDKTSVAFLYKCWWCSQGEAPLFCLFPV